MESATVPAEENTADESVPAAAFPDSKPHYHILDGLRGVAALMVICFHIFEAFATSAFDQKFNHGYLAVDFFFALSGFVVGYAYDNRWGKMSTWNFFKRRIIRLHPMVIAGTLVGGIAFYIQGCETWAGTPISISLLMFATLFALFLIPTPPKASWDVRGNDEMFPLNGPSWSLFFEYLGNILYALFIRRLPTKILAVLVALIAAGLAIFAIGNFSGTGSIGVGWTLGGNNFPGGSLRLLFSFSAGLLISRIFKPIRIKNAFGLCSLAIVVLLSMPHIGGEQMPWLNGIYDSVCVILVFPILVWLGASGTTTSKASAALCKFLGDISFPIYIIHYPFMYIFYAYCWGNGIFARADKSVLTFSESWPAAILVVVASVLLSWVFLKIYDEPVRKLLSKKFLPSKK